MQKEEVLVVRVLEKSYAFGLADGGKDVILHKTNFVNEKEFYDLAVGDKLEAIVYENTRGYAGAIICKQKQ